jgi:tRNA threonylcarbamoyladenosine biosynthesis protein TsaE
VNSPTSVLMNEHAGRLPLLHIDAYRLTDPEEAMDAGLLDERQAHCVTVIEWADRLDGWLPADRLEIWIAHRAGAPDEERTLRLMALGERHDALATAPRRETAR